MRYLIKYTAVICTIMLTILNADAYEKDKTAVMPGSHCWDVDNERFDKRDTADFFWTFDTKNNGCFRTVNSAKMAMVKNCFFDKIDLSIVCAQNLIEGRVYTVKNGLTQPGTVIVFQTAEGKYGKLEILGFRSSHDFAFKEAANLPDKWKKFALKKPEIKNYHLEVKWRLFE